MTSVSNSANSWQISSLVAKNNFLTALEFRKCQIFNEFLLIRLNPLQWESRSHFFAIAAQLMRQIIVDYAHRHRARNTRRCSCQSTKKTWTYWLSRTR